MPWLFFNTAAPVVRFILRCLKAIDLLRVPLNASLSVINETLPFPLGLLHFSTLQLFVLVSGSASLNVNVFFFCFFFQP